MNYLMMKNWFTKNLIVIIVLVIFVIGACTDDRKNEKEMEEKADSLHAVSLFYYSQGRLNDALNTLQQALAIDKTIGNLYGEAAVFVIIGYIYNEQGRNFDALNSHQQANAIHEALKFDRIQNDLANLRYVDQPRHYHRLQNSLNFICQADSIHHAFCYEQDGALYLNNMGNKCYTQGMLIESINFYQRALAIYQANNNKQAEAIILNNIRITRTKAHMH